MLYFLRRHRFVLGGLVFCLLLILTFYFLNKGPSHVLSKKHIENSQIFRPVPAKSKVGDSLTQNPKKVVVPPMSKPEVAEKVLDSLVLLEVDRDGKRDIGSGFFVRPNQIATCFHVIAGITSGRIKLVGTKRKSKIDIENIISDEKYDLALLKVDGFDISPLSLGTGEIGESVRAVGNPLDVEGNVLEGNISKGIISGIQDGSAEYLNYPGSNAKFSPDEVF